MMRPRSHSPSHHVERHVSGWRSPPRRRIASTDLQSTAVPPRGLLRSTATPTTMATNITTWNRAVRGTPELAPSTRGTGEDVAARNVSSAAPTWGHDADPIASQPKLRLLEADNQAHRSDQLPIDLHENGFGGHPLALDVDRVLGLQVGDSLVGLYHFVTVALETFATSAGRGGAVLCPQVQTLKAPLRQPWSSSMAWAVAGMPSRLRRASVNSRPTRRRT